MANQANASGIGAGERRIPQKDIGLAVAVSRHEIIYRTGENHVATIGTARTIAQTHRRTALPRHRVEVGIPLRHNRQTLSQEIKGKDVVDAVRILGNEIRRAGAKQHKLPIATQCEIRSNPISDGGRGHPLFLGGQGEGVAGYAIGKDVGLPIGVIGHQIRRDGSKGNGLAV